MTGGVLSNLTLITNFVCMAISLWFSIYLLARGLANPLTFRAVVALLSLAFYYNNAFTDSVNGNSDTGALRSLATLIALIATHDLTHYLLPLPQRRKLYWVPRGIVLLGVVAIVLLFTATPRNGCGPNLTCPSDLSYPWVVIDSFKLIFLVAILYNLWLIKQGDSRIENVALYGAFLLGVSTIGYSVLGTGLKLDLPRFIPNLLMLAALLLLLYSVARDQSLITRRTSPYDLPITMITIMVIVGVYILSAWQIGLTATSILLLAVLAIFTHSTYDFVREFLNRLFLRQEHDLRVELRKLARETSSDTALQHCLRRGLAILCHNLHASNGLIAARKGEQFEVVASLHGLPVGSQFSADELTLKEVSQQNVVLMGNTFCLVPAYEGSDQVGIVGVGARKDKIPFSFEDLCWLEDIAEEIGRMIGNHRQRNSKGADLPIENQGESIIEPVEGLGADELLSKLAYNPDLALVKCVEEGFRNLNDYSQLGKSPLVTMLGIRAQDHIECGKLVKCKLIEMIEKLRPSDKPPCEPLPREWYAYTILHDAYVEERLTREIMAKLYISEGTYYRMRRHALRGITRALLEMGTV